MPYLKQSTLSPGKRVCNGAHCLRQHRWPGRARRQRDGPLGLADPEAPQEVAQQLRGALCIVLMDGVPRLR